MYTWAAITVTRNDACDNDKSQLVPLYPYNFLKIYSVFKNVKSK